MLPKPLLTNVFDKRSVRYIEGYTGLAALHVELVMNRVE